MNELHKYLVRSIGEFIVHAHETQYDFEQICREDAERGVGHRYMEEEPDEYFIKLYQSIRDILDKLDKLDTLSTDNLSGLSQDNN